MKITDVEFNILTGKETITEREETATEKALREKTEAEFKAEQAEAEAREIAKAAILDRLGLTADEAKLLLS